MRKNRMAVGMMLFVSLTAMSANALYFHNELVAANKQVDETKALVETLRKENTNLHQEYQILQTSKEDLIKKLDEAKGQIDNMKKAGCWYIQEGIATAYSPNDNRSGIEAEGAGHLTSVGLTPGDGIIAVDPKRIPYGSKMKVLFADGTSYEGIAGDTGGALRSDSRNHVDIYKDTYAETEKFGVKNVTILWQPK